ncbi:PAS domain S-box protein [Streptomyces sp. NPDC047117]|uniref:PAS domain S-box protein n=1 Tax=Streptomyces sp. NPDC047117 TaxID=3155379 RepID=UPI003409854A
MDHPEADAWGEEDGYRRLVQALKYCVLVHDARTKDILWANRAACDLLGFSVDELRPLKAPDMSGNARQYRRETGVAWLQRAAEHGTSATEWCYRSRSGEEILTEAIAIRVDLPSRAVVMVQFRDIAEEKAVRRDLFRTEGRLRAFLPNLAEGIVVLDDDARVTYASESAGKLLGTDAAALTGSDLAARCRGGSAAELRRAVAAARAGAPPQHARYRMAAGDATVKWFAATCQRIDIESDLRGALLLFHDITDRVREEEEHRRDLQQLNHLARENAMGDMAMAIAHELSQPLAAASNFVAGARGRLAAGGGADQESVLWGLDHASRQIERASRIIAGLRSYVMRLEQSEQLTDLNAIVEDCAYFFRLRAGQRGAEVALELSAEPLPVRCEAVLIGQVVLNLAFNAIDEVAGLPPAERRVEITTRRAGEHGELRVRDHGPGLAGIPRDRIFDGVFTSKENGSGIGLALSHRIITRHGGRIRADDHASRGAVFSFALPLAAE